METKISFWNKFFTCAVIFTPLAGFAYAIVHWWGHGVSAFYLILTGLLYLFTGFGMTVGYHRLFTHRSFKASPALTIILGIAGSMAIEGTIWEWCVRHIIHHVKSDKEDDPHSPYWSGGLIRGFIHAHVGWIFTAEPSTEADRRRYIPHLLENEEVKFVNRHFALWAIIGLVIPAIAGAIWENSWRGAWLGFLWGGLVRIFLVHHVTWSTNSAVHIWGRREYQTDDMSKNNPWLALFSLGEGWHNFHHAFSFSARHGYKWWELDLSYALIKTLEKFGLASDVRVPNEEAVLKKRLP